MNLYAAGNNCQVREVATPPYTIFNYMIINKL